MKRQLSIKVLSGLLNIFVSLILVTTLLYLHHWFGKEDFYTVLFWTIPVAVALAVSGKGIIATVARTNIIALRILVITVIALAIAYVWTHFVYLFVGSWMHAFSFPVLYVWLVGIFAQLFFLDRQLPDENKRGIVALILFPFVMLISLACLYGASTAVVYLARHDKEIFLIPQNFKGKFRIVYETKCGMKPRVEQGSRVLEIPDNGLLIIRSRFRTGIVDHEYYFQDSAGKRVRVNEILTYARKDTLAPGVLLHETGVIPGTLPDGTTSKESSLAIHYTDFIVIERDTASIDKNYLLKQGLTLDSLTHTIVQTCRDTTSVYATANYRRPIYYVKMR
jgi:hypothetical protein